MTVMSMPVLWDCTVCGASVVLVIDGDGAREVCTGCGLSQKPSPPRRNRAEVREQVRQVKATRPLLCPSCLWRRCFNCHESGCECPGNHPRRPA